MALASGLRIEAEMTMPEELAGLRVDQALAQLLPEHSRSRLKAWLEDGGITLDGSSPRPRDKVAGGETVRVDVTVPAAVPDAPQAMDLAVLHEDAQLVVLDKPAGLVVHPGAGNARGTLLNGLLHRYPECERLPRAGIVHRLDKDTSGVMVVARSLEAHTALVAALSERAVTREYLAVCVGELTGGGTVDQPLGRHPTDRKRQAVRADGKPAVTHYRVSERLRGYTLIRCTLETGRTHQIRVHLAHLRHPLVGDPVYGGRPRLAKGMGEEAIAAVQGFRRQALHAQRLGLTHPISGEALSWEAAVPEDLAALIATLRADLEEA